MGFFKALFGLALTFVVGAATHMARKNTNNGMKKNYDAAIKAGAKPEDAKNKAYQAIIDSSKKPNEEVNKTYGIKKP